MTKQSKNKIRSQSFKQILSNVTMERSSKIKLVVIGGFSLVAIEIALLTVFVGVVQLTLSKKSKPGKTKDDEFKISISTEDINKIDEKIKGIGVEPEKGKTDEDYE